MKLSQHIEVGQVYQMIRMLPTGQNNQSVRIQRILVSNARVRIDTTHYTAPGKREDIYLSRDFIQINFFRSKLLCKGGFLPDDDTYSILAWEDMPGISYLDRSPEFSPHDGLGCLHQPVDIGFRKTWCKRCNLSGSWVNGFVAWEKTESGYDIEDIEEII